MKALHNLRATLRHEHSLGAAWTRPKHAIVGRTAVWVMGQSFVTRPDRPDRYGRRNGSPVAMPRARKTSKNGRPTAKREEASGSTAIGGEKTRGSSAMSLGGLVLDKKRRK